MFSQHKFYRSIILSSLLIQSYVCMPSYVQLFGSLWTIAHQAPLSMGYFRQEYWSGLLFPISFYKGSAWLRDWICLLCLLHFRQILYPLSHQGNLSIPQWKWFNFNHPKMLIVFQAKFNYLFTNRRPIHTHTHTKKWSTGIHKSLSMLSAHLTDWQRGDVA